MKNLDTDKVLVIAETVLKVIGHALVGLSKFMMYLTKCAMVGFRL